MNNPVLYIVVPCYNEEEVLPETSKRLKAKLSDLVAAGKVSEDSRVLFVDDGSKDRTWEMIRAYHEEDPGISKKSYYNVRKEAIQMSAEYTPCKVCLVEGVVVRKLHGEGAVKRRIMDMGITKGAKVHVRKVAPLGDPVEVTVRGYELSIRKEDAEKIEVE